jgi:D-cysteine desulfhydrase
LSLEDFAASGEVTRRSFLKLSAAAAVGIAAAGSSGCSPRFGSEATPHRALPIDQGLLPLCDGGRDGTAISRRYPWTRFGEKPGRLLQIAGCREVPAGALCDRASGRIGERTVQLASGLRLLPWAPMFPRPTKICAAPREITPAGVARLFIKDEGSDSSLLFGNKIRKYEFLLPNLSFSGVRTLRTLGAYGSNHCAYLTLAARYGRYAEGGRQGGIEVEVDLYPQELSDNVLTKLRLLVASGARLRFLEGDTAVGLSILQEELRTRSFDSSRIGYVAPGGSSPLSVLGHVEAALELAEQIEGGGSPLEAPPDYIFVPLGSGATAMGLVLGCHLLGWPTVVVGTCSQDKGALLRLAVNGDANRPFLHGNAASLLEKSLKWVAALGLRPRQRDLPSGGELLRRHFACDSETWHPAYGKVTPAIAREAAEAAVAGLSLDTTFTAKSFHTLKQYAAAGLLRGKSALLWNTYQRFPLEKILPQDNSWPKALPDQLRGRVEAYLDHGRRRG